MQRSVAAHVFEGQHGVAAGHEVAAEFPRSAISLATGELLARIGMTGVILLRMSSVVVFVVLVLSLLGTFVGWSVLSMMREQKTSKWPVTPGTIQSVGIAVVNAGRHSYSVDVGYFYYKVHNEYHSGKLTISPNTSDRSPRSLVDQKIEVSYDPKNPGRFSIVSREIHGFLLQGCASSFGEDVDPLQLNI